MGDETGLERQWRLLRILGARHLGATIRELAQESGVSEKTIRRDLQTFAKVGFQLQEEKQAHGRKAWKLVVSGDTPSLSFNIDEALALYLGRRFLDPLAGTYVGDAAQRAFVKIKSCLGSAATRYVEKMAGNLCHRVIGASDYSQKSELIDRLMQGIEERHQVYLTYRSLQATEPVSYHVYPYGLAYFRGSLYLVAHAPDHEEVRHYKVDRIEDVAIEDLPFTRPDDFDLASHLAGAFGVFQGQGDVTVRIRFAPAVARYVAESRWHASQQLAPQRDGSLLAQFRLSHTEEIKRWIMSFGSNAEVLEPAQLRDEVVAELSGLLAAYQSTAQKSPQGQRLTKPNQPR